jgi:thymidylate kinase
MPGRTQDKRTLLVSFSGIDGAGKSTQIEALSARLAEGGLRVRLIRFWDDVARLKGIRETSGHKLFKGDKGIGSPSAPINRRDKNVQSWAMTCIRFFLYFVDAVSVRQVVKKALRSDADVVIFDRYTWDELANLNPRNPIVRAYIRMLVAFVPRLHVSYLLDAEPLQARSRKPEYPLDFLHHNREAYLTLARRIGGITVIAPMPIQEAARQILERAREELSPWVVSRPEDLFEGLIAASKDDSSPYTEADIRI